MNEGRENDQEICILISRGAQFGRITALGSGIPVGGCCVFKGSKRSQTALPLVQSIIDLWVVFESCPFGYNLYCPISKFTETQVDFDVQARAGIFFHKGIVCAVQSDLGGAFIQRHIMVFFCSSGGRVRRYLPINFNQPSNATEHQLLNKAMPLLFFV